MLGHRHDLPRWVSAMERMTQSCIRVLLVVRDCVLQAFSLTWAGCLMVNPAAASEDKKKKKRRAKNTSRRRNTKRKKKERKEKKGRKKKNKGKKKNNKGKKKKNKRKIQEQREKRKRGGYHFVGWAAACRLFTSAVPLLIDAETFACCVFRPGPVCPSSSTWKSRAPPAPPCWHRA